MTEMLRINMSREAFAAARADEDGVNALTVAMKSKLAAKRNEGYGGWNRPEECTAEHLAALLLEHLPKGDPVDIANFCMMLFNREGGADALRAATARSPGDSDKVPGTPPDTSWNKRASPPGGEWRWVPVEPTEEMFIAGDEAILERLTDHTGVLKEPTTAVMCYRAMLSAAPPHLPGGEWQGIDTASQSRPSADGERAARPEAEPSAWTCRSCGAEFQSAAGKILGGSCPTGRPTCPLEPA